MKAKLIFEIYCPIEEASEDEFIEWIKFQIGQIDSIPLNQLSRCNLELIESFADREIIEDAKIEIIKD